MITTRWTWVEVAGGADSERAREALAFLCQAYWYPLYAYVRRCGVAAPDAEDVVQSFFARLIERGDLSRVSREGGGRFRAFLRVAIKNHLVNERAAENALKRGGGRVRLAIDAGDAERRLGFEPAVDDPPERAFDRAWARAVLFGALEALGAEYEERGQGAVFRALRGHLQAGGEPGSHAETAQRLGLTPVALRVAVHRLRERYRRCIEAEVAATVGSDAEVRAEVDDLFQALGA